MDVVESVTPLFFGEIGRALTSLFEENIHLRESRHNRVNILLQAIVIRPLAFPLTQRAF